MMPIGDDDSNRRTVPIVTYALIAINVLVYLFEIMSGDPEGFVMRWGTIPSHITAGQDLHTLFTSMFLHDPSSWLHLLGNMLFLWIFGDNVEDAFGHGLYTAFYVVCGLAAGLAQVLVSPTSDIPGIGASGAIAGVLAGYIVMFGTNPVRVSMGRGVTTVPAYVMIGLWIVLQVVSGIGSFGSQQGGVAYWAHIGGFVAGLVLTFVLRMVVHPNTSAPVGTNHRRTLQR